MSKTKIKIGSKIKFMTAPTTMEYMENFGAPSALIKVEPTFTRIKNMNP